MSPRRSAWLVLATALAVCAGSVSAGASTGQTRPTGAPDLAAMALAAADFPGGARVVRERYYRDPDFEASYERELALRGSRVGRSRLAYAFNDLNVEATPAAAATLLAEVRRLLRTRRFRNELGTLVAQSADVEATAVAVGRSRSVRVGNGAVSIPIALRAQKQTFQTAITFLRVDRVLGTISLVGMPAKRVFDADVDRLSNVSAQRMRTVLVPAVSTAPVVSGAPRPGELLSSTTGTWTGDQLVFAYQWERCVEPGESCAPIPGATTAAYRVVDNDLASSLRVTVSGRNRLGSGTTTSRATNAVAGPEGAPVATVAPVAEGVVGQGATLTATTGTWTGNPTAFAYQWRRCNPATRACVDIDGATEESYTLTAPDSGSLIRVLVIATNAIGSGGALSPPTAPAP